MVERVYERVSMAASISRVVVATCDLEIMDAVRSFGGQAVMTRSDHTSGTDRIAEVAGEMDEDVIVNVQGDEPLINPLDIDAAVQPFAQDPCTNMVSLMFPIDATEAQDPNLVKVVVDKDGRALYFSRAPIPYQRKTFLDTPIWGHVGMYSYNRLFLLKYGNMPVGVLERAECLEQLRALENGITIKMVRIDSKPVGVDTPEDIEKVRQLFAQAAGN